MADVAARPTVVNEPSPAGTAAITAERYTSAEWMQREVDTLWPGQWLFACLERDVLEPGEFVVLNIANESILVSRSDDGELGAFFNVCQHRGARVMVNDAGWVKNFVCPYHGWTYDRAGALTVVPDIERFSGRLDCAERSLKPLRVESFNDMVWVCMDPTASPLHDFLGPLVEILSPYDLSGMALVADQTVRLDCNWKAVVDNFGELYHVEHIHPQHELRFDCPTAKTDLFAGGHTGVEIFGHTVNTKLPLPDEPTPFLQHQLGIFGLDANEYHGRVLDIRADIPAARRATAAQRGYDYSTLTDIQLTDIEQYNVFPNIIVTVQPDDAIIMRSRPHPTDPNKCYWDKLSLHRFPDPTLAEAAGVEFAPDDPTDLAPIDRPQNDEFDQDDVIAGRKTMTKTIDQDIHLIRDVQAGMRSRGFDTAILCDDESRVQHYHDWLNHFMDQ